MKIFIVESKDVPSYSVWKRRNVTYRGIKSDNLAEPNDSTAMMNTFISAISSMPVPLLGDGLYSVPAINKNMAKAYGELYILVNARPKNPKKFRTYNDAAIWIQDKLFYPYLKDKVEDEYDKFSRKEFDARTSIADEMLKMGYDGIEIVGREMVNYKPDMDNIRYFENERQLEMYYDTFVADI